MTFKNAALATTALIALSANTAFANGNDVYLIQDGSNNKALINQEGAIDSALGNGALIAQQIGDANELLVSQIGGNNMIGQEGDGLLQEGSNNYAWLRQDGFDNTIGSVVQRGDGNRVWTFHYSPGDNNRIGTILQDSLGSANTNHMGIGVTGSNNGHGTFTGDAAAVGLVESSYVQLGGANGSDHQIYGDNNLTSSSQVGEGGSALYYYVSGDNNQTALSIEADAGNNILGLHMNQSNNNNVGMRMRTTGSVGNYAAFYLPGVGTEGNTMWADQLGDDNSIVTNVNGSYNDVDNVQLGIGNETVNVVVGDYNTLNLLQNGDGNAFMSDTQGSYNATFAEQMGNNNSTDLAVNGHGNNTFGTPLVNGSTRFDTPLFSAQAADAASSTGLTAGALLQTGFGNTMDIDVGTSGVSSNNNLFAVMQDGSSNSVMLSISGENNQAAIVQTGDFNVASVTQIGNGNNVGIMQ